MGSNRDQVRAAALVVVVVLTAAMFAGFAFGTTARQLGRDTAATPLLLKSVTHSVRATSDCDAPPVTVRQAKALQRSRAAEARQTEAGA